MKKQKYQRPCVQEIIKSLQRKKYLIDIIVGPRQVGKTTAAMYIAEQWKGGVHYANADMALDSGTEWVVFHWNMIRQKPVKRNQKKLLILDEIQKIPGWSEVVKGLWDEDRRKNNAVKVLLLGSSTLLMAKGMSESLTGRFMLHRFTHWSYPECKDAFGLSLNEWLYYGGYPGAAELRKNRDEWRQYITDSLIETAISRDVLALQTIHKPALLRNLFTLSSHYPAQELSYNKMLGQLHDAGNTTTLTHYLKLLETAFLVSGLENYSGSEVLKRSSSPKLIVWNNALVNSLDTRDYATAINDRAWWGRLVENAVGAYLMNNLQSIKYQVMYWRHRNSEVDYVVYAGAKLWAIEVKSGRPGKLTGLSDFCKKYKNVTPVIIGTGGMEPDEFFVNNPQYLLK